MASGDLSAARASLAQALDFAFAIRADGLISYLTINLAVAQLLDGESQAAEQSFQRCLVEALRVGNRSNTAHAVLGLALCALGSGDEIASARLLGAAEGLIESSGAPFGAIEASLSEDGRQRLRRAVVPFRDVRPPHAQKRASSTGRSNTSLRWRAARRRTV